MATEFMPLAATLVGEGTGGVAHRRAVSTAYYALLHELCHRFADLAGGAMPKSGWERAYRSLDHTSTKHRCQEIVQASGMNFSHDLKAFAAAFVRLQEARIRADYLPEHFADDARELVAEAADVLRRFAGTSTDDQRGFVLFVSLKSKGR